MNTGRDLAGPPPLPEDAVAGDKAPVPADQEPPEPHDLSKADYARTTADAPDHTALIPAIKDEPAETGPLPAIRDEVTPPASAVSRAWDETPKHAAPVETEAPDSPPRGLRLVRIEPYSVTRLAFVVSVALMIVSVVAMAIFWIMLAITGVWGQINDSVASLLSDDSGSFDIKDYLGFGRMVGGTLVLSGINVILMTALATVGAHLYNLAAELLGGVEATFTDD